MRYHPRWPWKGIRPPPTSFTNQENKTFVHKSINDRFFHQLGRISGAGSFNGGGEIVEREKSEERETY